MLDDVRLTLHDLDLAELRAYYRTLGGTDEIYDRDRLRSFISIRSAGDAPPHTPNNSGHPSA